MSELLKTLLSLSVSGTLLMAVVFFLRPFLKDRISKAWQYYIWLAVVFRLIIPLSFNVNLAGNLFTLAQNSGNGAAGYSRQEAPVDRGPGISAAANGDGTAAGTGIGDYVNTAAMSRPGEKISPLPVILMTVWLLTGAGMLLVKLLSYRRFLREIGGTLTQVTDNAVIELFELEKKRLHIKGAVGLYVSPLTASPLTAGLLRPYIVLTRVDLPAFELRCILDHELVHYKRKDILYKWAVIIVSCIHWFNPCLIFLRKRIDADCELACDEAVMKEMDGKMRRAYGDTLLHAMFEDRTGVFQASSVSLLEGKKQLKERLGAIMNYGKLKMRRAAGAAITGIVCFLGISFGVYAAPAAKTEINQYVPGDSVLAKEEENESSSRHSFEEMKEKTARFTYTQDGYYEYPYVMDVGFNLPEQHRDAYTVKKQIQVSEKKVLTCYFSDETARYAQEQEFLDAFARLYPVLSDKADRSGMTLEYPFIVSVGEVKGRTVQQLAAEYYEEGHLTRFSAVFPWLEKEEQRSYAYRMYDDGRVAFFGAVSDKADPELLKEIAQKAGEEGVVTFFSIAMDALSEEETKAFALKAYEQGDTSLFAIAVSSLGEESQKALLDRAVKDKKSAFIYLLENN